MSHPFLDHDLAPFQPKLPYSTAQPPAWYNAQSKTKQLSQTVQPGQAYAHVEHSGEYLWNEQRCSYAWSCCEAAARDARGCTAASYVLQKERVIVARSDSPQKHTAGKGFGSTSQARVRGVDAPSITGNGAGVAVVKQWEHRGTWQQLSDVDGHPRWMWSCCLKEQKDSRGCTSKVLTKEHRWNLETS